jgi:hypothetical protein
VKQPRATILEWLLQAFAITVAIGLPLAGCVVFSLMRICGRVNFGFGDGARYCTLAEVNVWWPHFVWWAIGAVVVLAMLAIVYRLTTKDD